MNRLPNNNYDEANLAWLNGERVQRRPQMSAYIRNFLRESNPFRLSRDAAANVPAEPAASGRSPLTWPEALVREMEAVPWRRAAGDALKARFDERIQAVHAEAAAEEARLRGQRDYIQAVGAASLQVSVVAFIEEAGSRGLAPNEAIRLALRDPASAAARTTPQS